MVTGEADRRHRRAVGVDRGGGRDAPVGQICVEGHLLHEVAHDAASHADYQVGGERPHLRRKRLSELERGNGRRIAGQDAGGDVPGADRSLPALPGGRLGALVAQHPQRRSAAVSLQEAAGGGIERALSEDHLHWREAVRLATWAPLAPETGLQLVKERVRMVGHGAEEEGRFRQ